jgi:predicted HTH transcriptional regulator
MPISGTTLTPRTKEVLELIRRNPGIRRGDIAKTLQIANATAEVHCQNLRKMDLIVPMARGWWDAKSVPCSSDSDGVRVPAIRVSSIWELARVL